MRRHPLFKRLPSPQAIVQIRLLKPFARYLEHHSLWQFNRRAVACGVAIGLFFGILVPFGQIPMAAFAAFFLRGNLPVAAFATFITNPFTTAGVYYCAYLVGGLFHHPLAAVAEIAPANSIEHTLAVAVQEEAVHGWYASTLAWIQDVGFQLLIGLSVMSVLLSAVGYFAVSGLWHYWVRRRWRYRQLLRAS
jgi:uncharacterized protein (DUF2062 family)